MEIDKSDEQGGLNQADSLPIGEKLKLIRTRERLNQKALAELVGIPHGTYQNYELGHRRRVDVNEIFKIITHPRFSKYLVWFVTGHEMLKTEQINPY